MLVTVDIDGHNHLDLIRSYYNLLYYSDSEVRVYQTNHGYHLVTNIYGIGREAVLEIRKACLDDPLRIAFDYLRIRTMTFGVLWRVKHGRENERLMWRLSGDSLYMPPDAREGE